MQEKWAKTSAPPAFGLDEPEPLGVVEPLDGTEGHVSAPAAMQRVAMQGGLSRSCTARMSRLPQRSAQRLRLASPAPAYPFGPRVRARLDRMTSCPPSHRHRRQAPMPPDPHARPRPTTARARSWPSAGRSRPSRRSMYQVVLLNDDYTPMEFVVMVLQEYFNARSRDGDADHAEDPPRGSRRLRRLHRRTSPRPRSNWCWPPRKRGGHPLQCIMEAA